MINRLSKINNNGSKGDITAKYSKSKGDKYMNINRSRDIFCFYCSYIPSKLGSTGTGRGIFNQSQNSFNTGEYLAQYYRLKSLLLSTYLVTNSSRSVNSGKVIPTQGI